MDVYLKINSVKLIIGSMMVMLLTCMTIMAEVHINKNTMYISWYVSQPDLSNILVQAELYANNNNMNNAANELEGALAMTNSLRTTFNKEVERSGTLELCIRVARLHYLGKAKRGINGYDIPEYKRLIKEYADKAKGRQWKCYKIIYRRLVDYYYAKEEYDKAAEMYEAALEYDPTDYRYLQYYLKLLMNRCECITKNTRKIINDYIQSGGVWDEWLAYMNCKIHNSLHSEKGKDKRSFISYLL